MEEMKLGKYGIIPSNEKYQDLALASFSFHKYQLRNSKTKIIL